MSSRCRLSSGLGWPMVQRAARIPRVPVAVTCGGLLIARIGKMSPFVHPMTGHGMIVWESRVILPRRKINHIANRLITRRLAHEADRQRWLPSIHPSLVTSELVHVGIDQILQALSG